MNIDINQRAADNIRILAMAMVEKAKSGHPGGSMGGADFIHILFSEFLNFNPDDPSWINRDRFFLDPGHMSPMLYSVLTLTGHFTIGELKNFRQWGSKTPGHPELNILKGIEIAFQRLLEKKSKENGELVYWKDGHIIRVKAKDLLK